MTKYDVLVNHTNHKSVNEQDPSRGWSEAQMGAALQLADEVIDLPFPVVNPRASSEDVVKQAGQAINDLINELTGKSVAFLVQGEMSYVMSVVLLCKTIGVDCYVATSERNSIDLGNGKKTTVFNFVQFRKYPTDLI